MAQEDQVMLDDESGQEYNDDNGDYDGQEDYQDDDEGDSGDVEIGEEIVLTHEEIWDDSALIEAWDAAVKQYETYHSKTNASEKATIPSESTKRKSRVEQPASELSLLSKRTKLTNGEPDVTGNGESAPGTTAATASDNLLSTQVSSQSSSQGSSDPAVTERKPSFRKADKPSFHHLRQSQLAEDATTKTKSDPGSSRTSSANRPQRGKSGVSAPNAAVSDSAVPAAAPPPTRHPPVDVATIAYYQQLGYYYDPSYDSTTTVPTETGGGEGVGEQDEQQGLQEESDRDGCSSRAHNATTSKSNVKTKNRPSTAGAPSPSITAAPQATFFGTRPSALPYPQGYYNGYHPQGMSGPSTIPPGWTGHGVGVFPMPFAHGPIPVATGRLYPQGMMPPQPPPLAAATALGHPPFPGQFPASGMDDEALSNLIMAWYFSGYYTGLYQAQRR